MKINTRCTVIIILLLLVGPGHSFAEGRRLPSNYDIGGNYLSALYNPPGWQFVLYPYYLKADSYWNEKGKKSSIDLDSQGIVYRPIYTLKWDNSTLLLNLVIPHGEISMKNPSTKKRETSSGVGDIAFYPSFYFSINKKHKLSLYLDAGFYLPVGDYKKGRIVNLGTNQFSLEPAFGLLKGWCFGSKEFYTELLFQYLINWENKTEHFKPGDMWEIQSTWNLAFSGKLFLGLSLKHYQSVNEDEKSGHKVKNSEVKGTVAGTWITYQVLPKCNLSLGVDSTIDGENTAKTTLIRGRIFFLF